MPRGAEATSLPFSITNATVTLEFLFAVREGGWKRTVAGMDGFGWSAGAVAGAPVGVRGGAVAGGMPGLVPETAGTVAVAGGWVAGVVKFAPAAPGAAGGGAASGAGFGVPAAGAGCSSRR